MVSGGGVWRGFLKGFLEGVSGGGFWRGFLEGVSGEGFWRSSGGDLWPVLEQGP